MSRYIVLEGWLTKSPPTKRIWRTKWRRRWFALRQSGELPGQYYLDYYADRNSRRLKGTINLDLCEQVDAGLHMGRGDPKIRGSIFSIQTQSRTYHLEADCEEDMLKWVDAICRVCGLKATDDTSTALGIYQNAPEHLDPEGTGPYIPISECITGVRAQDCPRAFTFDPKNIVTSARFGVSESRAHPMYMSQPHIRLNAEFSENESNLSDEECKSLNASQSNIRDWSVTKTFTKLSLSPKKDGGPPVPPRPPKTFTMSRDISQKEAFHGPRIQEPIEYNENLSSMQYYNLPAMPPAVDRALKPRHSSHSIGHISNISGQVLAAFHKSDVLHYLDLDLHTSKPSSPTGQDGTKWKKMDIIHGKSYSAADAEPAYKTVDFLKTEAFNITRQDAEASRNNPH